MQHNQSEKSSLKAQNSHATHLSREMQECIDNCIRCHRACEETLSHCLHLGGPHADPHHILLLRDCAQICAVSADFMLRQSDLHPMTCGVCAQACLACAEDCEHISEEDEMMNRCAQLCRACSESCRQMAAH